MFPAAFIFSALAITQALQAELIVNTLAATDITGDSALLNMSVTGDEPGTTFAAQIFEFGVESGNLTELTYGYDFAQSFVYDPILAERVIIESYNVRDLYAYFDVIDSNTLFSYQTYDYVSTSTPLTLNLWDLSPETTYYVRASAMDINTGEIFYGEELSFSTYSFEVGGHGIQFSSTGVVIPESSHIGLWLALTAIGFVARRRQRS